MKSVAGGDGIGAHTLCRRIKTSLLQTAESMRLYRNFLTNLSKGLKGFNYAIGPTCLLLFI